MTTEPPTESAAASLLNGRTRWVVYVTAAATAGAWTIIETEAAPHWGFRAAYAAFSIAANLLAASNTAKG